MKKPIITLASLSLGVAFSQAATIRLDNVGSSTGDNIDGITGASSNVVVAEVPGLFINVHAITGNGAGSALNVTASSLGVNSGISGDATDRFEAENDESFTFSFSQSVSISQLDFTNFEDGDEFSVVMSGGTTAISYIDLTNGSTDIYDFSSPLILAANEQITIRASAGEIGIEGMTLTVIPEPSSMVLLGLGALALILRRRN